MKELCFLINSLSSAGGTERVTTVIANALDMRCYSVSILTLDGVEDSFFDLNSNIRVVSVTGNKKLRGVKKLLVGIVFLRNFIKKNKVDTLICVDSTLSFYTFPATFGLKKVRNFCWEHFNFNSNLNKKSRDIGRLIASRFLDHVIVLTNTDRELWASKLKNRKAEITTIHNPSAFPRQYSYNNKNKTVLCIGRLEHQKGFDMILQSWAKIRSVHDWKLVIVGDGIEKQNLQNLSENLKLNNVFFKPATRNIEEHFLSAGLFCLPSRFEGYVLVLVEALTFGLPAVAFNCETGPADILKNDSGVLVEPENVNELALQLEKMIFDDSIRQEYSSKAYEMSENFTTDEIIKQWITVLER